MAVIDSAELLLQAKNYSGSGDWLDESGNSHDATPQNAPTFDGIKFTLNGTNEYFIVDDHANLDFDHLSPDATFMAWMTHTDVTKSPPVFYKGFQPHPYTFLLENVGGNAKTMIRRDDGAGQVPKDTHGDTVASGTPVVAAGRFTGDTLEAFSDGVGTGSPVADTTTVDPSNASALWIGRSDYSGTYLAGDLYAVAIWRSALSDADIVTAGAELQSSNQNTMLLGVG